MDRVTKAKQGQVIEKEIYLFYVRYIKKYGYAPSYKEVAEGLNISIVTVQRRVTQMTEKGYFHTKHRNDSRAIAVTGYEFRLKKKESSDT